MRIKKQSEKRLKQNLRWDMLKLVYAIEYEGAFSNLLINDYIRETKRPEQDQSLVVKVVYGVVQHRYTLDFYLAPFLKGKKVDKWIASLLRIAAYQLVYLDRIPDHAVVNEAVQIAKINGHQGLGNFVNGILRSFIRTPLADISNIQDKNERLSIQYSIQQWMIEELEEFLEATEVEELLESLNEDPVVSARINAPLEERAAMMEQLEAEGFQVEAGLLSPYGIRSLKGNPVNSSLFQAGKLTIQDESSMLVAPLGQLKGDEEVLDPCAAPGGKATHIASLLTEGGHVTAVDLSAEKLEKLVEHAERMGLSSRITAFAEDARKVEVNSQKGFDVIYLDAPCSGLGLMRRKPEIKYVKAKADLQALAELQMEILVHVAGLLKAGGKLIYSTCTLSGIENENLLTNFLNNHKEFKVDPIQAEEVSHKNNILTDEGYVRIWPHLYHTDGFFISRLIKEK